MSPRTAAEAAIGLAYELAVYAWLHSLPLRPEAIEARNYLLTRSYCYQDIQGNQ